MNFLESLKGPESILVQAQIIRRLAREFSRTPAVAIYAPPMFPLREKRTAELKEKEAKIAALESKVEELKAIRVYVDTVAARLDALESRQNQSVQIAAEQRGY